MVDHNEEQEHEHYLSVALSFREYEAYLLREIFRRKSHAQRLLEKYKKHLPNYPILHNIQGFTHSIRANQQFLEQVIRSQEGISPPGIDQLPIPQQRGKITCPERHFSKIKSTLHQCVRDWADEGALERQQCYDPILEEIQRLIPLGKENRNAIKVLVPGAGLGRLALELVGKGYSVQGNEFSYQMLFVSNFVLNCIGGAKQVVIHPWIDNPSNTMLTHDSLRPICIPDVCPADLIQTRNNEGSSNSPDFSMCAGEFLDAYKDQSECWDCLVTCFFIDAAPNILEYIETIHRLLKPGGMWINLGPLLYHWQNAGGDNDPRYDQSIELSYEDLRTAIESMGFQYLREERRECLYTCNRLSMLRNVYNCVFFSVVKPCSNEDYAHITMLKELPREWEQDL